MRRRSLGFAAVLCMGLLSVVGAAYGQQTLVYDRQVVNQLNKAKAFALERGFAQTHEYHIDGLHDGQYGVIDLDLDAGMSYFIVGVCDQDCQKLDLALVDENKNLVDKDVQNDRLPILTITPKWSGNFTIGVRVASCQNWPCRYGVAVFGMDRRHSNYPGQRSAPRYEGIPTGPMG